MSADKGLSPKGLLGSRTVAQLQLAVRFFRLYPHDHPFCADAIQKARDALSAFAKTHGTLSLEIRRNGLAIEDEVIQADSNAMSSDLSSLLFTEGVRELILEPELEFDELMRFIEILAAPYPQGDEASFSDDLLTTLWREDFKAIEYRIFDPLAASFVRERRDKGSLGEVAARIRGLVEELGGRLELGEAPAEAEATSEIDAETFFRQLEEREEEDDSLNWATRPERAREFLDTEGGVDRRLLANELLAPEVADSVARAAEVVVWALEEPEQVVADLDAARFLAGSTLHALKQGDLAQATRMTEWVSQASESRESLGPTVFSRLSTADGLASLSEALTSRTGIPRQAVATEGINYLSRLGSSAIHSMRSHYPDVESALVRSVYRDFMVSRIEDSAETLAALARNQDPNVAREAVDALASLGPDSVGFGYLRDLAQSEGAVRQVALERIDDLTGETERRDLLNSVARGHSEGDRLAALAALAKRPTARTFAGLVPILEGTAILDRSESEMRAIVDVMRESGGARTRVVFRAFVNRRVPLLRRRSEVLALREIVLEALEVLKRGGS